MRIHRTLTEVDNLKKYSLAIGLLTCWFLTHPYTGIRHDSLLYVGQALSRLYPEVYKNDIFILYGFQDNYTIFSRLYAFAIHWLGLNNATITLMFIGYALWLSASFYISRILLKGKSFWIFLALLFTLPSYYGAEKIFSYGEPFLTPRIFAEALTIFSIAFLIKERFFLSVVFLFSSLLFHPLVAGCGCIFLLIYRQKIEIKKVILKLLIAISVMLILTFVGIEPFPDLFRVMDKYWYDLAQLRNSFVFVGTWDIEALNIVIFDSCVILSSIIMANEQQRSVLISVLFIGVGCLVLSWIGTDILHNVFIIKVQLWRAFWLTHWFAYFAMALLIANWENSSNMSRILLLCFITAWFSLNHIGGILSLMVLILFYINRRNNINVIISKRTVSFTYLLPVVIGSFWLLIQAQDIIASSYNDDKLLFRSFVILFLLETRVFITIVFISFWKLMIRVKNRFPIAITLILMLLISSLVVKGWSFNPKISVNKRYFSQEPFKNKIPVDSVVYWQDSIERTWLTLNRSCYASYRQGSAILFSRELALIWEKRLKNLKALGVKDSILSSKERSLIKDAPGIPTIKGLDRVCHDPELDFVVLSSKFSDGLIDEYYDKKKDDFYYLYDCQYIRENSQNT